MHWTAVQIAWYHISTQTSVRERNESKRIYDIMGGFMTYSSPKTKGYMSKIPYIVLWVMIGIGYTSKAFLPELFAWLGVLLHVGTGILYVISALRKNTMFYHTYIGWAWIVPTILFAHIFMCDVYAAWNYWVLLTFSACISIVLIWLWRSDRLIEHVDNSAFLNVLVIIFLTLSIACCPKIINSSKITEIHFREIEVSGKYIYENWRSWNDESYHFELKNEDDLIHSDGFSVSKEYFDMVHVGDEIPVCIYTGLLGKKFYSVFEDPDSDFYGYNEWTREKYAEYLNETQ